MDIHNQSTSILGGFAGILGSALLLGVFAFLSIFVGLETLDAQAALDRYPEIRWARIIENTAYLFALALWALHSVTLYIVLRPASPAISLAAVVMSVLGLAILAAGAIPAKRPFWVTMALWQGISAPVIFALVAIVGGAMRPGYSHVMQAISELTEAGAADKPYLDPPLFAMQLLTFVFGLGFWWAVRRAKRMLRISAACLMFIGLLGLFYPAFPMDPVGSAMTFDGRMHLIIVSISAFAAIFAVAASARGWFLTRAARKMMVISASTLLIMLASGVLAGLAGTLGWARIGVWQRANTGAFSVWEIATAIYLLRASEPQ